MSLLENKVLLGSLLLISSSNWFTMTLLSKKNESKLKTDKGSTTAILKDWNKTKKLLSEVLIQSSDFMC